MRAKDLLEQVVQCHFEKKGADVLLTVPQELVDRIVAYIQTPDVITSEYYQKHVGVAPINDDIDRCNCPDAGKIGHSSCGWNYMLNKPATAVSTSEDDLYKL